MNATKHSQDVRVRRALSALDETDRLVDELRAVIDRARSVLASSTSDNGEEHD